MILLDLAKKVSRVIVKKKIIDLLVLINKPVSLVVHRSRCHSEVLEKGKDREACCNLYESSMQCSEWKMFCPHKASVTIVIQIREETGF